MSIEMKSIADLQTGNYSFVIPGYQRGYRWGEKEATFLFNDLEKYIKDHKENQNNGSADEEKDYYCMQPLSVSPLKENENRVSPLKKNENQYNVIDGQQRLTTVHLLLTCLKEEPGFNIEYDTRNKKDGSPNDNADNLSVNKDSIDYHFMNTVQKTLTDLIKNNPDIFDDEGKKILKENVYFIWYENEKENEQEIFERLNVGKIPLSSSELIKALFLNRTNFKNIDSVVLELEQNKIASKWDEIEHALQNDEFWGFIMPQGSTPPETRISYIFDIIRKTNKLKQNAELDDSDEYASYNYFNKYFEGSNIDLEKVKDCWNKVEKIYMLLDEWYQDILLYHYIGFLTSCSDKNDVIIKCLNIWNESKTKADFTAELKKSIYEILKQKKWLEKIMKGAAACSTPEEKEEKLFDELKKFKFEETTTKKTECRDLLTLHNVDTIIQQNEHLLDSPEHGLPDFSKFPFHLFKTGKWEIEHIRPNAGDALDSFSDQQCLLGLAQRFLDNNNKNDKDLYDKIDRFLELDTNDPQKISDNVKADILNELSGSEPNEDSLNELFKHYLEIIKEKYPFLFDELEGDKKNLIWNYTLLDKSTNSSYGNRIFPIKREYIRLKQRYGICPKEISWDNKKKCWKYDEVEKAVFVPVCTENVFTKFYTQAPKTTMCWTEEDAEEYLKDIVKILVRYI